MDFSFDVNLVENYKSNSQKIRVLSESWVGNNVFCPCCGNPKITHVQNNQPVSDFVCENCSEIFELKSKNGKIGRKIADGAYSTMIERISSNKNTDLFVMQYDRMQVQNLWIIPKFFFLPQYIEKRKPLAETARRAGWVGCNILFSEIPTQGKITVIDEQKVRPVSSVVDEYGKMKSLQVSNIEKRGWLMDILYCVNSVDALEFSLKDIYAFTDYLGRKHPENHNIEAKIRQQLQVLRDKNIIAFLGDGKYIKIL